MNTRTNGNLLLAARDGIVALRRRRRVPLAEIQHMADAHEAMEPGRNAGVKVGDRVRVVDAAMSFGDYENGDEATVKRRDPDNAGMVYVAWATARYPDDPEAEAERTTLLYPTEYEVVGSEFDPTGC